jgi:phage-related protein
MQVNTSPEVTKFISSFDKQTKSKVYKNIALLEEFGNLLKWPHSRKISGKLFELRITGQLEIRFFYCFHKNEVYILHAFIKKTQKTPIREISTAQKRYKSLTVI